MQESKQYVRMMIESLEKKSEILSQMMVLNAKQAALIEKEQCEGEDFEHILNEKAELIQLLNRMDEGFEALYGRMRDSLNGQKELWQEEIIRLQELIGEITDKSLAVQAGEERNRRAIETQFAAIRSNMQRSRTANRVAADYYKSANKMNFSDPQFMDKKK